MSSLLDDVIAFLDAQGLVDGVTDWGGYVAEEPPDTPDLTITVYETGGLEPEIKGRTSTEVEYDDVTFQIRGRGAQYGYAVLHAKMKAIYLAVHDSILGSSDYNHVRATQSGPMSLGLDSNGRPRLTWNFVAMRRRDAGS